MPGAPDVAVVDPPRAGLSGKALRRLARLEAPRHRLRLVQPDDAGRRTSRSCSGVGLPPRARAAGGHVPAHAARRGGGAAHPELLSSASIAARELAQPVRAGRSICSPPSRPRPLRRRRGTVAAPARAAASLGVQADQVRAAVVRVRRPLDVPAPLQPAEPGRAPSRAASPSARRARRRQRALGADQHVEGVVLRLAARRPSSDAAISRSRTWFVRNRSSRIVSGAGLATTATLW